MPPPAMVTRICDAIGVSNGVNVFVKEVRRGSVYERGWGIESR